jgi:hypothetical protein
MSMRDGRPGHDSASPLRVRREDAVIAYERVARRSHQRGKPRQELHLRHDSVSAASAGVFDSIRHAAVRKHAEPLESEAGSGTVAHESLAAFIIAGFDAHCGLYVEPIELRCHRPGVLPIEARLRCLAGLGGFGALKPGEGAATQRDVRARIERAPLRRLVGSVLGWALLKEPFLPQPAQGAVTHTADDPIERFARWRARLMEAYAPGVVWNENAVCHNGMEMKVEIQ